MTGASARKRHLPPLLLALALSAAFVFGNDRGHLYRPGPHNDNSANPMAVVGNLSTEHNFARFYRRTLHHDGTVSYLPYHRFPPGGYWLLGLTTLPFSDGLSERLYAARLVMLCFFAAAAFLAYLAISRLVAQRWIAAAATALAFAGYYTLYYSDLVTPEGSISLFAVFLVFHGMVVFEQDGRFAQLLIKVCGALLLTWHVFALLLGYIVLNMGREWLTARRRVPQARPRSRRYLPMLGSRYVVLGAVSLVFGMAVLVFGLLQEHSLLNRDGEVALTELPSLQSMLARVGVSPEALNIREEDFAWLSFLAQQAHRVAAMCIPFALYGYHADHLRELATGLPAVAIGVAVGVAGLGTLLLAIRTARGQSAILLATVGLYGFFWALPMRYNTVFHDHESLHYVGIPLVIASLALVRIHRRFGARCIVGLALGALALLGLSSAAMSGVGNDAKAALRQQTLVADFEAIRRHLPPGEAVAVPIRKSWRADRTFAGAPLAAIFYLAGRTIVYDGDPCGLADFFIASRREQGEGFDEGEALLTPDNQLRFLYDRRPAAWPAIQDCGP